MSRPIASAKRAEAGPRRTGIRTPTSQENPTNVEQFSDCQRRRCRIGWRQAHRRSTSCHRLDKTRFRWLRPRPITASPAVFGGSVFGARVPIPARTSRIAATGFVREYSNCSRSSLSMYAHTTFFRITPTSCSACSRTLHWLGTTSKSHVAGSGCSMASRCSGQLPPVHQPNAKRPIPRLHRRREFNERARCGFRAIISEGPNRGRVAVQSRLTARHTPESLE